MTAAQFRKLALSFAGAVEGGHMGHADFRAGKKPKIFASLGAPSIEWGMVKLTPEEQRRFVEADAESFVPCAGAWGERGYTNVRLASAEQKLVRAALEIAFESVAGA